MDPNKKRKLIPSQRIIGSNKELFIIKYEGTVIEIFRTNNLYEPLVIQVNGAIIDSIPSKMNKEIIFITENGEKHKLEVWNERINNSPLIKALGKDGIAIVIDGIPIQNSLADPLTNLIKPKILLWILTIYYFFISLIFPLSSFKEGIHEEFLFQFIIYIVLFLIIVVATISFSKNPIRSIYSAILPIFVDLGISIYSGIIDKNLTLLVMIFLSLRIAILLALFYSIKNIKQILDEDIPSKSLDKPTIREKIKKLKINRKKVIITFSVVIVLLGSYFAMNKIIEISKLPSIERDNSIELLTDLKLPELIPYRKGDKWGYCDRNKNIRIQPVYSEVKLLDDTNKFIQVNKNGKWGIIGRDGKQIIPCIYDYLNKHNDRNIFIASKGLTGMIDDKNNIIIPFNYNWIRFADDLLITNISKNNTNFSQIISYKNEVIYETSGLSIESALSSNVFKVSRKITSGSEGFSFNSQLYGLIDKKGKIILPVEFSWISSLLTIAGVDRYFKIYRKDYSESEEYANQLGISLSKARLVAPTKIGVIDKEGKIILPIVYDEIRCDDQIDEMKYITVKLEDHWGIVDIYNNKIFQNKYEYAGVYRINNNYYFSVYDKSKGFISLLNEQGEAIIPLKYNDCIPNPDPGYYTVRKNNRYGVISVDDNKVIPIIYLNEISFQDGYAVAKKVDQDTINSIYTSKILNGTDCIKEIHNGLIYGREYINIKKNDMYKYKELSEETLKEYLSDSTFRKNYYDENEYYLRNYADSFEAFLVKIVLQNWTKWYDLSGKYGYYNNTGEIGIDFIYEEAYEFNNGYAEVKLNGKWGLINKENKTILPFKFSRIPNKTNYDLFEIEVKGKKGYVDLNGIEYFED